MAGRHLTSSNLEADCARALYRAARAARVGSRQQIRAAVRRFVRRHRRDRGYLAWALRSARASSALAIMLLGFAAEPADARSTSFTERTGVFAGLAVGGSYAGTAVPYLADLDQDADLDLLVIDTARAVRYFENTGTVRSSAFVARTGTANPLNGYVFPPGGSASVRNTLDLADMDGDGDLDFVGGRYDGTFSYLENTGNATDPAFVERTGLANPFSGLDVGAYAQPAVADLDGDRDLDLAIPGRFFENTGDATTPAFAERTGTDNPLASISYARTLRFGDLDGDGDLDAVRGGEGGNPITAFGYWENTGTPTAAVFVARNQGSNPFHGQPITGEFAAAVALGDLDADGDLDLVAGQYNALYYFENRARDMVVPPWIASGSFGFPGTADVGSDARPALADLDGDGALDLLVGSQAGTFSYFGVPDPTRFTTLVPRTGAANPMNNVDAGSNTAPAFADLDGDGDLDLASGESGGVLLYFENTGGPTSPIFVPRSGAANPLGSLNASYYGSGISSPSFGDVDRDGDFDLVVEIANAPGVVLFFDNTGTASSPAFVSNGALVFTMGPHTVPALGDIDADGDVDLVVGAGQPIYFENTRDVANPAFRFRRLNNTLNPFNPDSLYLGAPALGDLDRDGDLDVLAGYSTGVFLYFRNAAIQPSALAVHALLGPLDPFVGESGGVYETPALGDLDGDGDPDIVAGSSSGALRYYENTGDAAIARFTARTGAASPLPDPGPGVDSAPALADLDADGDLDLLVTTSGAFHYFENTGDATDPVFILRTGSEDPLAGSGYYGGGNRALALGDLDADGDLDLVVGYDDGQFNYFRNTGDATNPHFFVVLGGGSPLNGKDVGQRSTPALADLDRDGDLDLVAGNADGTFAYFGNGSPINPGFGQATGVFNPFNGIDVGQRSAPALGDLDAYGNADLVAGSSSGFDAYLLPEPGRGWLFAAGAALLAALRRRSAR